MCNRGFSVTVGTLFHGTRLPLQKWFLSIGLMMRIEKDPSVRQLAQIIAVDKNTAGNVARRIRDVRVRDFALLSQVAEKVMDKNQ